jgi:hypothetical protein
MNDPEKVWPALEEMFLQDAREGLPEFSDWGASSLLLPHLNYDSQLVAIRHLLRRNKEEDEALDKEMEELGERARAGCERSNDAYGDRFYTSIYQGAAHSMAAAGMIIPLIESIFRHAFQELRKRSENREPPSAHGRWEQPAEDQWDCRFVWKKGKRTENVVEGILQLSEAVGLRPHLPKDLKPTLQALFEYRNKMFHCGFEWPLDDRQKFEKRIAEANWPGLWFSKATSGGDPWIFYLSEDFIQHALQTIDLIIKGLGHFVQENGVLSPPPTASQVEPS